MFEVKINPCPGIPAGTKSISGHDTGSLYVQSLDLLKNLISIPRFSRKEGRAADLIYDYLGETGCRPERHLNNVWAKSAKFDPRKPVVMLNSHLDTVEPGSGWKTDPFTPVITGDRLAGLGSNDAGASLVGMIAAFRHFRDKELPYNLLFSATAEEEVSGINGIESILDKTGRIDLTIVGEPTCMQMAVAEKGLMVLDCTVRGKAGHAAHNEGVNALYLAMEDIERIKSFEFDKVSDVLGSVKMTVTCIESGTRHNIIPDTCRFTVDVRLNELYTNEEIYSMITSVLKADVSARSFRLRSSFIEMEHPFVMAGLKLGLRCFGSPTLSNQALIPPKSIKIGPGDSTRSHTANEFIYTSEIRNGIDTYIQLLETFQF